MMMKGHDYFSEGLPTTQTQSEHAHAQHRYFTFAVCPPHKRNLNTRTRNSAISLLLFHQSEQQLPTT
jgi:hypothetical protein